MRTKPIILAPSTSTVLNANAAPTGFPRTGIIQQHLKAQQIESKRGNEIVHRSQHYKVGAATRPSTSEVPGGGLLAFRKNPAIYFVRETSESMVNVSYKLKVSIFPRLPLNPEIK